MTNKNISWRKCKNTVADRLIDGSCAHMFDNVKKIKHRTRAFNRDVKKAFYGNIGSYKKYVKIKTTLLRIVSDGEDTEVECDSDTELYKTYNEDTECTFFENNLSSCESWSNPEKKKRGRPKKALSLAINHFSTSSCDNTNENNSEIPKRKRGRPRKVLTGDSQDANASIDNNVEKPKAKRGRPRKVLTGDSQDANASIDNNVEKPKAKRGRPRKVLTVERDKSAGEDTSVVNETIDGDGYYLRRRKTKDDVKGNLSSSLDVPGDERMEEIKNGEANNSTVIYLMNETCPSEANTSIKIEKCSYRSSDIDEMSLEASPVPDYHASIVTAPRRMSETDNLSIYSGNTSPQKSPEYDDSSILSRTSPAISPEVTRSPTNYNISPHKSPIISHSPINYDTNSQESPETTDSVVNDDAEFDEVTTHEMNLQEDSKVSESIFPDNECPVLANKMIDNDEVSKSSASNPISCMPGDSGIEDWSQDIFTPERDEKDLEIDEKANEDVGSATLDPQPEHSINDTESHREASQKSDEKLSSEKKSAPESLVTKEKRPLIIKSSEILISKYKIIKDKTKSSIVSENKDPDDCAVCPSIPPIDPELMPQPLDIASDADSLKWILNNLHGLHDDMTDDDDEDSSMEESRKERNEFSTRNTTRPRPTKIDDIMEEENLVELELDMDVRASFTFEDVSDNEELFMMEIPKSIINNQELEGQRIRLKKNTVRIGDMTYHVKRQNDSTLPCVIKMNDEDLNFKQRLLKPVKSIIVRQTLQENCPMEIKYKSPECTHTAFPKNLKLRNPMVYNTVLDGEFCRNDILHKKKFDASDSESTRPRKKNLIAQLSNNSSDSDTSFYSRSDENVNKKCLTSITTILKDNTNSLMVDKAIEEPQSDEELNYNDKLSVQSDNDST